MTRMTRIGKPVPLAPAWHSGFALAREESGAVEERRFPSGKLACELLHADLEVGAPLLTPRFHGGTLRQVRWEFIRRERLHLQRYQSKHRHAKIYHAIGAIHHHADAEDVAAVSADNIKRLLDATALGHDILDDENLFARRNLEATPQNQFTFLLFDKDEAQAELPRDFLTDYQSTHRRRNYRDCTEWLEFCRQSRAEFFNDGHLLQREGALEELAAVQTAAQDKMSFEQRARVAENLENFVLSHGARSLGNAPRVTSL